MDHSPFIFTKKTFIFTKTFCKYKYKLRFYASPIFVFLCFLSQCQVLLGIFDLVNNETVKAKSHQIH